MSERLRRWRMVDLLETANDQWCITRIHQIERGDGDSRDGSFAGPRLEQAAQRHRVIVYAGDDDPSSAGARERHEFAHGLDTPIRVDINRRGAPAGSNRGDGR